MRKTIYPEGEALRRAIKWISDRIQAGTEQNKNKLINKAVLKFDLSPKDADFLYRFYGKQDSD